MIDVKLAQFSGPLDLLLSLIQEKKIEITELSISEVTEQYLGYVEQLSDDDVHHLADFLTVASRLLVMKSRLLLPQFFPEEEDEKSLEAQLKLYKLFADASKVINKQWLAPGRSAFHIEPARKAAGFVPPENCTAGSMANSMAKLLTRIAPLKPLPKVHIDRRVSVKEKIQEIRKALKKVKEVYFHDMISSQKNNSEVIVGFLALLELVKQQEVDLKQEETFGDILVHNAKH